MSGTYSYSSTGPASGAIGLTPTEPPPYVLDCSARMSTLSIRLGEQMGPDDEAVVSAEYRMAGTLDKSIGR